MLISAASASHRLAKRYPSVFDVQVNDQASINFCKPPFLIIHRRSPLGLDQIVRLIAADLGATQAWIGGFFYFCLIYVPV